MFNIISKEVNRVTALFILVFSAAQLSAWLGIAGFTNNGALMNTGALVAWAVMWLMMVIIRVSEKLAAWETAQLPAKPVEPTEPVVPLETKVRELLSRGKKIDALRVIRAEKGMSLDDAKEYLKQFDVTL